MLSSARIRLALLAAACLLLLSLAPTALAGEPATVTVRVVGLGGATLLPQTTVTTTTAPIAVPGGTCEGTSLGGALYDAIHGAWTARYEPEGVEIDGLEGTTFPSFAENPGVYWAFWLNGKYAEHGACNEEIASGADVVAFAQCYAVGPDCPTSATAPDHYLTATAPSARVVNVGEAVSLTVGSLSTASGSPETSLPAGATVTGGSLSVAPGAGGVATLSFPAAGTYTLQAHAPDSVPSDEYTICVHNGNDGNCGTTAPSSPTPVAAPAPPPLTVAPYRGAFALVAKLSGLGEDHVYSAAQAPRSIAGTILAHAPVTSVSLELRREYRGRCHFYDGTRERFRRARCGVGSQFDAGTSGSFSYLLPARLGPGRYVLDVHATDTAGNHLALARGTSRIVFYVR